MSRYWMDYGLPTALMCVMGALGLGLWTTGFPPREVGKVLFGALPAHAPTFVSLLSLGLSAAAVTFFAEDIKLRLNASKIMWWTWLTFLLAWWGPVVAHFHM